MLNITRFSPYQPSDNCLCNTRRIILTLLSSNMFLVPLACGGEGGGRERGGGATRNGHSDSVETAITEVQCPVSEQESLPAERQQSFIGARLKNPLFLKGLENSFGVLRLAIIIFPRVRMILSILLSTYYG